MKMIQRGEACLHLFFIKCRNCNYHDESYTSKTVEHASATLGRNTHDINIRAVYAIRHCGVGLSGLTKFCGLLNMPPSITQHSYDNINKNLEVAAENIAKESMKNTVEDIIEKEGTDIKVSVDGTWQRRGLSSLNGVVAAVSVSTGKVIDIEIMSRHC